MREVWCGRRRVWDWIRSVMIRIECCWVFNRWLFTYCSFDARMIRLAKLLSDLNRTICVAWRIRDRYSCSRPTVQLRRRNKTIPHAR